MSILFLGGIHKVLRARKGNKYYQLCMDKQLKLIE